MKIILTVATFFLSLPILSQSIVQIDSLIEQRIKEDGIPSIAISVIESGEVKHKKAYGFADLNNKKEATIKTPFHIASVSKIVTNLAVFKLLEEGKIDLNTDINEYLDFEVKNPHFPNSIITVSELLNHKSGIRDSYILVKNYWNVPDGDPKLTLSNFLYDYLNKEGKLYKKKNFSKEEDFKKSRYCNTGYALLGLIVERVSETDFATYCDDVIFSNLEMRNTGWFLKDLNADDVAKTYSKNKPGDLIFKGHNGYPDYPAGLLRTSIEDFTELIRAYLNKNDFLLQDETLNQITPPFEQRKNRYTWFPMTINENNYYTHGGGDLGVRTMVIIDVQNNNAIILFANAVYNQEEFIKDLERAAFQN